MKIIWVFFIISSYFFSAELLFKSSFEDGVYLLPVDRKESANSWWQVLRGSDGLGFSWPIKLQGESGEFQMIVDSENIHEYIENRLENDTENSQNRVLHQIIMQKEHVWTQDPYVVYTNNKEQKSLFLSYSLKYPKDLAQRLGPDGWLTFSEYKSVGDYRLALYIYSDMNQKLYWYGHGDNVVLEGAPYKEYWFQENRTVRVPVGEWFNVEIFWKRESGNDGRVWLAIDGEVVIDYHGSTKLLDPLHQIMLFTNYANKPIEQWVDNIEVWDDFPCGEGKSCHWVQED